MGYKSVIFKELMIQLNEFYFIIRRRRFEGGKDDKCNKNDVEIMLIRGRFLYNNVDVERVA